MANPEITNNDVTKLEVFNPKYEDLTVQVLGADTLVENTVLAYDQATGTYKATVSTVAATATARAILKQANVFSGAGTASLRCLVGGEVRASQLVFDNGTDTVDTQPASQDSFRTQLRDYGIIARDEREIDETDNQ